MELFQLKDVDSGRAEYLDQETGRVYADPGGLKLLREMRETEWILGDHGRPVLDKSGHLIHRTALSNAAAEHCYNRMAQQTGRFVPFELKNERDEAIHMVALPTGRSLLMEQALKQPITMRDENGKLVKMDLAISDVHTNAALPNYAAGYRIAPGAADLASPVILSPKASDVFYTWNQNSDFQLANPVAAAPGGGVAEINAALAPSTYTTVQYALAAFVPTEVQANADTPLKPFQKQVQVVTDKLLLHREFRVATLLQTSGSWNSNLVTTIAAGSQWDGGGASDPVSNIHHQLEQSYMPVTGIVMSELVFHDFLRNPSVQKYFTYKDGVRGLPSAAEVQESLQLPPIHVTTIKYVTGGAAVYVWGNHVVLLHQPAQIPPVNQMEVASNVTFRWMGGEAPDGTVSAGFLIRTYYDPKGGARGGTRVIVVHNDIEVQTSAFVGGLLLSAHQ